MEAIVTTVELDDQHRYTIDGRSAIGVTSAIAEAGLCDWTFVSDFYRDRGSRAHMALSFMVEHDLDLGSCPDDVVGYVMSCADFLSAHNARTISVERRVFSLTRHYAGTLDWNGLIDSCDDHGCCPVRYRNMNTLLDWKTSREFHPATAVQTIAYADALYEETKKLVDRRACVLVAEDGGKARKLEYAHADIRRDREVFGAALIIAAWRRENKIPKP